MKLVGLVSTYKEGALSRGAVESILECGLDDLLVYEGPAGDAFGESVPGSMFPAMCGVEHEHDSSCFRVTLGRWRTDGRKRDAMIQEAKRRNPEPETWAVVVDGDEILGNGKYLRDILQAIVWNDDPQNPTIRRPLWLIEADGAMSLSQNKLYRLDLVDAQVHSGSVFTVQGEERGWGSIPLDARVFVDHFVGALDLGRMAAWPPLPTEPYIYHRSHLRHPARRGARMHAQERDELVKAGLIKP